METESAMENNNEQSVPIVGSQTTLKSKKSRLKKALLIIGAIILVIVLWFAQLAYKGFKERAIAEPLVTEFIQMISTGNLDAAYNDYSAKRMRDEITFEQFKELATVMPCLYSGFQRLELPGFRVYQGTEGTIYTYSGLIYYSNGDQGQLDASLEKENGNFKIIGTHINITPERFKSGCSQK